ncbi:ankyrin repeat domain-containing protein [uncultured Flavonifractor sp.]|uniref:ankyrin repeat domain-containing protein n=1 Tax=uncultured Flavonifractor sp. TaxID=1193534 RepID=UPI002606E2EE|nr:ankyrin repeat domain-containing protein [uncultured Flavonifractor sp.]
MPVNLDNMLLTACKNGQKGIVQAFLKKGGLQLDKRDGQGATPLHYASAKGSRDIVKLLLDAGADASIADNQSRTALHLACQVGNKDIIRLLSFGGISPDGKTVEALSKGSLGQYSAVLQMLNLRTSWKHCKRETMTALTYRDNPQPGKRWWPSLLSRPPEGTMVWM